MLEEIKRILTKGCRRSKKKEINIIVQYIGGDDNYCTCKCKLYYELATQKLSDELTNESDTNVLPN